jgi:hypothetical protein
MLRALWAIVRACSGFTCRESTAPVYRAVHAREYHQGEDLIGGEQMAGDETFNRLMLALRRRIEGSGYGNRNRPYGKELRSRGSLYGSEQGYRG